MTDVLHVNLWERKRHAFAVLVHNRPMESVGKRIRRLREDRKLSQEQLAKRIGIKQGSLTQIETGITKAPAASTLVAMARVFEVDPAWLMTGKGTQHPVATLTEPEAELLLLFRALTNEGRAYILARINSLHREEHRNSNGKRTDPQPDNHKPNRDGH
jgi:transcriptional regulator with XRE-family HTH domain